MNQIPEHESEPLMDVEVIDDLEVLDSDLAEFSNAKFNEMVRAEETHQKALASPTPTDLLAQAMDKGLDTDTMSKLMDLQERYEANEARKAYADDMVKCHGEMPTIARDSESHNNNYAKLEHITAKITPIYTKYGFSIAFGEEPIEGDQIRITAKVLHRMGHAESFVYDLPLDLEKDKKTAIHAKGSSTTYARRYLTTMIFNLTIGDDTDGNLPEGGFITEDQLRALFLQIDEAGLKPGIILRETGFKDWELFPANKVEKLFARVAKLAEARK